MYVHSHNVWYLGVIFLGLVDIFFVICNGVSNFVTGVYKGKDAIQGCDKEQSTLHQTFGGQ
jgi:hypothetical protein